MNPSPEEKSYQSPDVRLTYFDWNQTGAPTVFMVHATGFHARCWDRVIQRLDAGCQVIAVDQRGHGRSERKGLLFDWSIVADDVETMLTALDLDNVVGVGHSMGGHCLVQVAARMPGLFRQLVLIDPVIGDPDLYADGGSVAMPDLDEHPIARRRNRWENWQAFFEHLKDRRPYSLWQRDILEDYCRHGLLPAQSGDGFELACPPRVEASVYIGSRGTNVYPLLPSIEVPVTILRAKPARTSRLDARDFVSSPTWPRLATRFPNARDIYLERETHFMPMQSPELVAGYIREACAPS